MIFIVKRTSKTEPPCENSVRIERVITDELTIEIAERSEEWWNNSGFNFRTSDDGKSLLKDFMVSQYEIEINTLEELVRFTREYGEIVLDENYIEIYDDYRE